MPAPAPTPLPPPPQKAEGVEITKQQNGRFIAFVGPRLQHTEPFLGVAGTNFFALRSWLDTKTGEAAHQLYVADSYYGGPYRWDGAHGSDNKPLRFIADQPQRDHLRGRLLLFRRVRRRLARGFAEIAPERARRHLHRQQQRQVADDRRARQGCRRGAGRGRHRPRRASQGGRRSAAHPRRIGRDASCATHRRCASAIGDIVRAL